jgi:thiol-disulfide isomerase/thioredoxin
MVAVAMICAFTAVAFAQEIKSISAGELDAKIKNNANKALIVDFFATWCPPCQAEIPGFIALYNEYKDKGVEIIGVSVDTGGAGLVQNFAKEKGINYPLYLADPDVAMKYGIRGIPDTHIYAPGGKLHKRHVGYTDKEEFEKQINELLK